VILANCCRLRAKLVIKLLVFRTMTEKQNRKIEQKQSPRPTDYDLAVDQQTDRFISLHHQLTYFLITASVAPLGFTLKSAIEFNKDLNFEVWVIFILLIGGLSGVLSAAWAISALRRDISSHRKHLASRYNRKSYSDLPLNEQKEWDKDVKRARVYRDLSFFSLIVSIAFQAIFFGTVFFMK